MKMPARSHCNDRQRLSLSENTHAFENSFQSGEWIAACENAQKYSFDGLEQETLFKLIHNMSVWYYQCIIASVETTKH